jgi:hypothetical protein
MESQRLNRSLVRIVGLGWLAFAIATITIRVVFAAPDVTLLIDRSYCEPAQWQLVVDQYADFYQQHQRGQINLETVILFSDLGEETADPLPSPTELQNLQTYGKSSPDRQAALEAQFPNARLLQCAP